mmetsp:Transcript_23578/g.53753  ORF Transcript_23578/g.53753 Transcript_23578/m.53753 type:complete len:392 (+) Transcript_23578:11-1186(+)
MQHRQTAPPKPVSKEQALMRRRTCPSLRPPPLSGARLHRQAPPPPCPPWRGPARPPAPRPTGRPRGAWGPGSRASPPAWARGRRRGRRSPPRASGSPAPPPSPCRPCCRPGPRRCRRPSRRRRRPRRPRPRRPREPGCWRMCLEGRRACRRPLPPRPHHRRPPLPHPRRPCPRPPRPRAARRCSRRTIPASPRRPPPLQSPHRSRRRSRRPSAAASRWSSPRALACWPGAPPRTPAAAVRCAPSGSATSLAAAALPPACCGQRPASAPPRCCGRQLPLAFWSSPLRFGAVFVGSGAAAPSRCPGARPHSRRREQGRRARRALGAPQSRGGTASYSARCRRCGLRPPRAGSASRAPSSAARSCRSATRRPLRCWSTALGRRPSGASQCTRAA